MMGKLNLDNIANSESIRVGRQTDTKKTSSETFSIEIKKTEDKDKLNLSDRASQVGKLVEQIKDLPDVRTEKVNALREKIQSGEYKPSGADIADAILKDENI
jgi:flagellar biosynthesis anti-sigma factor FlgM